MGQIKNGPGSIAYPPISSLIIAQIAYQRKCPKKIPSDYIIFLFWVHAAHYFFNALIKNFSSELGDVVEQERVYIYIHTYTCIHAQHTHIRIYYTYLYFLYLVSGRTVCAGVNRKLCPCAHIPRAWATEYETMMRKRLDIYLQVDTEGNI